MLGHPNPYVHVFSGAADSLAADASSELNIVLTAGRDRGDGRDPRRCNLPMADEVDMVILVEVGLVGERDIIVRRHDNGHLQRMDT